MTFHLSFVKQLCRADRNKKRQCTVGTRTVAVMQLKHYLLLVVFLLHYKIQGQNQFKVCYFYYLFGLVIA